MHLHMLMTTTSISWYWGPCTTALFKLVGRDVVGSDLHCKIWGCYKCAGNIVGIILILSTAIISN